jgi:putative intracellular protease/amidase
VFYPGGHGPLWDLAEDQHSIALIEGMHGAGKPVALVCHAPGALRRVKAANGAPLVRGMSVTGFSNSKEAVIGLADIVPFLVEDMLKSNGGRYSKADRWQPHVVADGNLITGQNPASAHATANALLDRLAGHAATCRRTGRGTQASPATLAR